MNETLPGGNMNNVVRSADTVLRDAGPWTPTVHRYLEFIAAAGIDWAPRPLGIENRVENGRGRPKERERLSFVDGDVPAYPLPNWVWAEEVLTDGARRLRRLHDASIGFPLDGAVWQSPVMTPSEVICHGDYAPHNLVFRDGAIAGAIDFDMCSPAPRLWDIAYFAIRTVPLTVVTPDGAPGLGHARRRVEQIVQAYGSTATWDDVLRFAVLRLDRLARFTRRKAAELDKPQLATDADGYRRDAVFLARFAARNE